MSTDNNGDDSTPLIHLQKEIKNIKENINDKHTRENENLQDYIYYNKIKINSLDQYSRCSNIEIRNLAESINQSNIEKYVF